MASYDIIGGIVSPEAKKELQELERMAKVIGESLKGIKIGQVTKGEKEIANLEKINAQTQKLIAATELLNQKTAALAEKKAKAEQKAEQQVEKTLQQRAKLIMSIENEDRRRQAMIEKASQAETIAAQKAEQRAAKEAAAALKKTGYINQLTIEVAELEQAYNRLSHAELKGTLGTETLGLLKSKREELSQLQAAYGKHTLNVGNYSSATKMLGINIGQVLKEMPNFAISMRTGIMSLTNNLPMLADTIKQVRIEQLAMIEAGKKAPSMFSLIAKSVFGLTGLMSVLMVLLQIFGGRIIEWVGNLLKGEKALNAISAAALGVKNDMTVMRESLSGSEMTKAVESINKLSVNLQNAKGNAKESEYYVGEFNKTLGDTFGKAKDVDEALGLIDKNKAAYIEAMKQMTFANTLFAKSAEYMTKIVEVRMKPQMQVLREAGVDATKLYKQLETARKSLEINEKSGTQVYIPWMENYDERYVGANKAKELIKKREEDILKIIENERNRQIGIYTKGMDKMSEEAEKAAKEMSDIWDANGWGFPAENKQNKAKEESFDIIVGYINKIKEKIQQLQSELDSLNAAELIGVKGKEINAQIVRLQEELEAIPYLFKMPPLDVKGMDEIKKMIIEFKNKIIKEMEDDSLANRIGKELVDKVRKNVKDELDAKYDKYKRQQDIIKESNRVILESANQITSDLMDVWGNYYQWLSDKQMAVTDEKIKQYEDETEAGLHTQDELSEYKERMAAYQDSIEEEYARKQFRLNQAKAIADIWIAYAVKLMTSALNPAAIAVLTGAALTSTALVASQQLPAFAEGGIMEKSGMAILGDGGKHELAISPSGSFFVSDNKPTMYHLERGTEIKPDINRLDLASVLAIRQAIPEFKDNSEMIKELKNVTNAVRAQKQGNFYGMPLIKQLQRSEKLSSRRRSLMN